MQRVRFLTSCFTVPDDYNVLPLPGSLDGEPPNEERSILRVQYDDAVLRIVAEVFACGWTSYASGYDSQLRLNLLDAAFVAGVLFYHDKCENAAMTFPLGLYLPLRIVHCVSFVACWRFLLAAPGKAEEEVGESDEPDLTASADLEDSR